MIGPPLFRREAVQRAARRLDGKVILAVPAAAWISALVITAAISAAIVFAFEATYARKEVVRGWITWSSGLANVRAPTNTVITAITVNEGDWVREGQTLAWADASRMGGLTGAMTNGAMITAPVSGQVIVAEAREGMVTNSNSTLFVLAREGGRLQARMLVPSRAVGFLEFGQEVRLAIDAFPFQRFGSAGARISQISGTALVPGQAEIPLAFQEASYIVDAELTRMELEAYGQPVRIENGMQFSADIIIDRRSLIEWLLDPLYAAGRAGAN
jgi:multidrug efflux pump subunit AcrA (membrane-fusion protein)